MGRNFVEAIKNRRSIYGLSDDISLTDEQIEQIISTAIEQSPSSFNSQSTRVVLLLKDNHKELWDTTKAILEKLVSPEQFAATEAKIDGCFKAGYGTVLFYEDVEVVEGLQAAFPSYSERFPVWSEHASAINQFVVWTMLEDAGLGASLQHYNPLIDEAIAKRWNINPKWKLIAQLPFGKPTSEAGEKAYEPIEKRLIVFK